MKPKRRNIDKVLRTKSFPIHPPSYWASLGHDQNYTIAIKNLQLKMVEYIRRPHREIIIQPIDDQGRSMPNVHILHDEALASLWKYLAIALRHRDDCPIDHFSVHNVELTRVELAMLSKALGGRRLRKLHLSNNNFGSDGVTFAAEVLEKNQKLDSFCFNLNEVNDAASAMKLAQVLEEHASLKTLDFRCCNFGSDSATLDVVLPACRNVTSLNLRNIGSHAVVPISHLLASNPCIEAIYLQNNNIDCDGASLFSGALMTNIHLKKLFLKSNPIQDRGHMALLRAIFNTESLNSIVESNHKCELVVDRMNIYDKMNLINNFTRMPVNRDLKILFALHDSIVERSDFNLLDNLPVEFVPDLFEQIQIGRQRYSKKCMVFNYSSALIFEVLRGWRLPLLFSFLGGSKGSTEVVDTKLEC